jgi:hypothetical protein
MSTLSNVDEYKTCIRMLTTIYCSKVNKKEAEIKPSVSNVDKLYSTQNPRSNPPPLPSRPKKMIKTKKKKKKKKEEKQKD